MPKTTISKNLFYDLIGERVSTEELRTRLEYAKAELDEEDETTIKVELNDTNRPDLWTAAGLARQLTMYSTEEVPRAYTFPRDENKKIKVEPAIKDVRPYIVGFVVSGKKITTEQLEVFIETQEKLSENFGKKRKALAMGIYREEHILWPIMYGAADPKVAQFTALDCDKPQTLAEILSTHPKGKEYGAHIRDNKKYPLLWDASKAVLSMPPIINSAHLGEVKEGDNRLFVECTGMDLEVIMVAANIFACDCSDMGFAVEAVETEYTYETSRGKSVWAPLYFQEPIEIKNTTTRSILGMEVKREDTRRALGKMGVSTTVEKTRLWAHPPIYRNDFLHEVDVVEDVMIGIGMDKFRSRMPQSFTKGKLHPLEELSRRFIATMVGVGFQEMIYPYLGSEAMFITAMYPAEERSRIREQTIRLTNPVSENYEILRPSAIPSLLESERVSAHSPYPHRMCEIGKVAIRKEEAENGCETKTVLSFLIAGTQAQFTEINSVVAAILYYEDLEWQAEKVDDARFIDRRCARVMSEECPIGVFGEIHPRVLQNFDITMPCAAGELSLEGVFNLRKARENKKNENK